MIFDTKNGEPSFDRDIQVYPRIGVQPIDINILSPNLDPMTYPLFFPYGEPGWQPNMKSNAGTSTTRPNISMLQYKVYQTFDRVGIFNPILHGGILYQQ